MTYEKHSREIERIIAEHRKQEKELRINQENCIPTMIRVICKQCTLFSCKLCVYLKAALDGYTPNFNELVRNYELVRKSNE